eukprot:TRINITY_DN7896_c0_g1_i3.p3 TRINITY_DN7896_c0_g1~~TRINITY_DN7896_c0_g1_i3.p3  ORF type:complete len:131 (-),score=37.78 TRINITY_DN7896_c0_g1_i3:76-468(-)
MRFLFVNKLIFFFFSSRRRHTRFLPVSWARRCVQETASEKLKELEQKKKDSNNSISKHEDEISYQVKQETAIEKGNETAEFLCQNQNMGYPTIVKKKPKLLKKSMFKFGTVNSEVVQEQEEKKAQNSQFN